MNVKIKKNLAAGTYDMSRAKRLIFFREKYIDAKQNHAAEDSGIKQSNWSRMESGVMAISGKTIEVLEQKYKLNREWLLTGEGEPIAKSKPEVTLRERSLRELQQDNNEMRAELASMRKTLKIMEANQTNFLKRIEQFMEAMQRK